MHRPGLTILFLPIMTPENAEGRDLVCDLAALELCW